MTALLRLCAVASVTPSRIAVEVTLAGAAAVRIALQDDVDARTVLGCGG
jgi:hypothetical protein